ncbi:hypothetical protein OC861_006575 [Tilletia horrida]|nr:hypothetical protein OC845_006892 [Tilletia horrida]KAK0559647.1 hypothetical protein OC861_006575 [Tilletia horrida]
MSPRITAAVSLLALAASASSAFELTSPSSSGYWVACENNTLSWTSNSTDASEFSVALIDTSNTPTTPSLVNGNYQIANGLQTSAGSAVIELNCISASSSYQILFVNSSQYELEHPQVYFSGALFEVKPNGTAPASSSTSGMTTSIVSGSSPTSAPSGSSSGTGASTAPTTTASNSNNKTGDASARASAGLVATLLAVGLAAATAVLA